MYCFAINIKAQKKYAGAHKFISEGSEFYLRALGVLNASARNVRDTALGHMLQWSQMMQIRVFWLQKIIIYAYIA